jgi:hypothetical protein
MSNELDGFYKEVDALLKFQKDFESKNKIDFEIEFIKLHNFLLDYSDKLNKLPRNILENLELQIQFVFIEYNTLTQIKRKKLQFEYLRLKEVKLNIEKLIKEEGNNKNTFQDVFEGIDDSAFKLFKKFINRHYLDPYTDFSFIFQYMKKDGYIGDLKHKVFIKWLYENNYIKEKDFQKFMEKSGFRAYSKLNDSSRLNTYLEIKKSLF